MINWSAMSKYFSTQEKQSPSVFSIRLFQPYPHNWLRSWSAMSKCFSTQEEHSSSVFNQTMQTCKNTDSNRIVMCRRMCMCMCMCILLYLLLPYYSLFSFSKTIWNKECLKSCSWSWEAPSLAQVGKFHKMLIACPWRPLVGFILSVFGMAFGLGQAYEGSAQ